MGARAVSPLVISPSWGRDARTGQSREVRRLSSASASRWQYIRSGPFVGALVLTVLLHAREELDNDLRGRSDEHLTLALSLSVDDGLQAVVLWREMGSRVGKGVSMVFLQLTHIASKVYSREQRCGPL